MSTDNELYENFRLALQHCSSEVLKLSDVELEYLILEDLDIEYFSEFHESTLNYLLSIGKINDDIYQDALLLRDKIESVIDIETKREAETFRNDQAWLEIYKLSDKILSKLDGKCS
jgi:hypothetical protein